MQQETNESSSNRTLQRVFNTPPIHNHGEDDRNIPLSSQLPAGEGRVEPRPSAGSWPGSEALSDDSEDAVEASLRASSVPRRKTGSPVDKILEHERASPQAFKKRSSGPTFTVVARAKKPSNTGCSIADFPNGMTQSRNCKRRPLRYSRGSHPHIVPPVSCVFI